MLLFLQVSEIWAVGAWFHTPLSLTKSTPGRTHKSSTADPLLNVKYFDIINNNKDIKGMVVVPLPWETVIVVSLF